MWGGTNDDGSLNDFADDKGEPEEIHQFNHDMCKDPITGSEQFIKDF